MRCDWANDRNAPAPCRVVRTDTGEVISPCALADEETGEFIRYIRKDGKFVLDASGQFTLTEKGIAPLRIEVL